MFLTKYFPIKCRVLEISMNGTVTKLGILVILLVSCQADAWLMHGRENIPGMDEINREIGGKRASMVYAIARALTGQDVPRKIKAIDI